MKEQNNNNNMTNNRYGSRRTASFLCLQLRGQSKDATSGMKSRSSVYNILECFYQRHGNKESMEAWPTSPVLVEEKNARQKEKTHRYYERQLKACSWYTKAEPHPCWIQIVETYDDTCSECRYKEPCGCVLVANPPSSSSSDEDQKRRCATIESCQSSLSVPTRDSSRASRLSRASRTSTEDERSFYDNLCTSCKASTLERRARKYGEWRQRWSSKMTEIRSGEDPPVRCTCTPEKYSFQEWKNLYEQDDLVRYSRVVHAGSMGVASTSDYGTQRSKDSESTTLCRDWAGSNMKSTSLGYNTDQDLDTDSSSYSPRDLSGESGTDDDVGGDVGSDDVDMHLFDNELLWMHEVDCALEQMKKRQLSKKHRKSRTSKTRPCRTNTVYTKATVSSAQTLSLPDTTSFSEGTTSFSDEHPSFSDVGPSSSDDHPTFSEGTTSLPEDNTSSSDGTAMYSEPQDIIMQLPLLSGSQCSTLPFPEYRTGSPDVVTSYREERSRDVVRALPYKEGDGIPVICVTPTDYVPPKYPTENDDLDPFLEFMEVAKSIDQFYERLHAEQFQRKRVTPLTSHDTSLTSHDTSLTSHDTSLASHDTSLASHDTSLASHDTSLASHDTSLASQHVTSSTSQHDTGTRRKSAESDNVVVFGQENIFSEELRKRIQSLEQLCSFVDEDEDIMRFESPLDKQLGFLDVDENAVWRLSQESIELCLSRRTRSNTSSSSNHSPHSRSTSGSNSRSSTRQDNHRNNIGGKLSVTSAESIGGKVSATSAESIGGKISVTSSENILCSPDSGFSEKTSSFPVLNSPDQAAASPLGTPAGWAGSMQWDYTDCSYYFGFDCETGGEGDAMLPEEKQAVFRQHETSLATIKERPATPQNPLDWDW